MTPFRFTTWNVNSIRARQQQVHDWLAQQSDMSKLPDILCLQEIKSQEEQFPYDLFTKFGYNDNHFAFQKTYNGVAMLSRYPVDLISTSLEGMNADRQARFIEIRYQGWHILGLYAPNGNPVGTEKFSYKLQWLSALTARAQQLLSQKIPVVIGGDYNIIPQEIDCYDAGAWQDDALFQPETRKIYHRLVNMGYTDCWRTLHPETQGFSFWDYQAGAWPKNHGIRIDHILTSPEAAARLQAIEIDRMARDMEKPSDHVPVTALFS